MSEGCMKHEPVNASPYMGRMAENGAVYPDVGESEKEAGKWGRPYLAVLVGFGGGGETAVLLPIGRGRANHLAGSGRGDEGNGRWAGGLGSGRPQQRAGCILNPR